MRVLSYNAKKWEIPALLDGRKTVARRAIDIDISNQFDVEVDGSVICYIDPETGDRFAPGKLCRYQPGDILYVRETWRKSPFTDHYIYRADGEEELFSQSYDSEVMDDTMWKWQPSIHMPKAAARIWLKVTDVRVERLQDMYVDDAIKEGAWGNGNPNIPFSILREKYPDACNATASFAHLWDSTIKKKDLQLYGWDANPWVWRIEFERCEKPEED